MNTEQRHHLRGAKLLLVHCSHVDADRVSAAVRLEQQLGRELVRFLLRALVPRGQGRRGSSSP